MVEVEDGKKENKIFQYLNMVKYQAPQWLGVQHQLKRPWECPTALGKGFIVFNQLYQGTLWRLKAFDKRSRRTPCTLNQDYRKKQASIAELCSGAKLRSTVIHKIQSTKVHSKVSHVPCAHVGTKMKGETVELGFLQGPRMNIQPNVPCSAESPQGTKAWKPLHYDSRAWVYIPAAVSSI